MNWNTPQRAEVELNVAQQEIQRLRMRLVALEEANLQSQLLLDQQNVSFAVCMKEENYTQNQTIAILQKKWKKINQDNMVLAQAKWKKINQESIAFSQAKWKKIHQNTLALAQERIKNNQLQNNSVAKEKELKQQLQQVIKMKNQLQMQNEKLKVKISKSTINRDNKEQLDNQIKTGKIERLKRQNEALKASAIQSVKQWEEKIRMINQKSNKLIKECRQQIQNEMAEKQENEKIFYRSQIQELNQRMKELQGLWLEEKARNDPNREIEIQQAKSESLHARYQAAEEINQLAARLREINQQKQEQTKLLQKRHLYETEVRNKLQVQVKNLMQKLIALKQGHEAQKLLIRRELSAVRNLQAQNMKAYIYQIKKIIEEEKEQWQNVLKTVEEDNMREKKHFEEEKKKFIQEKEDLKKTIKQLREINKTTQNAEQNMFLKSLKDIQAREEHFTTYENSITFLDRALRKAILRIQSKDTEIKQLLRSIQQLREQTQGQVKTTRNEAKSQCKAMREKLLRAQYQLQVTREQVRMRQRERDRKEKDEQQLRALLQKQNLSYKQLVDEMQLDFNRLTENKKTLQQSYRDERDDALVGKAEINQERNKKWVQIAKNRNRQQIIFREEKQKLLIEASIAQTKLKQKLFNISTENQLLKIENDNLKQELEASGNPHLTRQNLVIQMQKKIAAVELEIQLKHNLVNALESPRFTQGQLKQKTQLDVVSEGTSQIISSDQFPFEICNSENPSKKYLHQDYQGISNHQKEPFIMQSFNPYQ